MKEPEFQEAVALLKGVLAYAEVSVAQADST